MNVIDEILIGIGAAAIVICIPYLLFTGFLLLIEKMAKPCQGVARKPSQAVDEEFNYSQFDALSEEEKHIPDQPFLDHVCDSGCFSDPEIIRNRIRQ